MQILGTIAGIWRYPVKSLAAEALEIVQVLEDGIPGDRAQALVVRSGHARIGKPYRGKENNMLHLSASAHEGQQHALARHVAVDIADDALHYFDAAPISIIFDRWLHEASELVGYALEPLRYRPNFFARADAASTMGENDLVGATVRIGEVVLRVTKPIGRCVTTTYDLRSGESDPNVLRQVAQHRQNFLGIYCDVLKTGTVALTDSIVQEG
ncbi:MAG: MOSC domain-containing protein [Candidatus Eremiobacteraeota bacterium]|nr:MOSC domain-containing protein [Candidatus Eremiobacteraeota bacterium]